MFSKNLTQAIKWILDLSLAATIVQVTTQYMELFPLHFKEFKMTCLGIALWHFYFYRFLKQLCAQKFTSKIK